MKDFGNREEPDEESFTKARIIIKVDLHPTYRLNYRSLISGRLILIELV